MMVLFPPSESIDLTISFSVSLSSALEASSKTKIELGLASRAVAVDMESYIVGEVAKKAGIPFMTIRAIADPVERSIPDWLLGGISEQGNPLYGAILGGLASHPWDIIRLAQLNFDTRLALRSITRISSRLGPLLGLG